MGATYIVIEVWRKSKMYSQKIIARIDAIDKTKLLAIALMGSYARGEAGKYSDIDIVCFSEASAEGQSPLIEVIDEKYLVISFVSSGEVQSWFTQPEKATEYIGGLRFAQPIWDPTGYFAELQKRAFGFVWDESLQQKANIYASKSLFGWLEEVHKALQGLLMGDTGRMLNGLQGLTYGIFNVVRVQRGTMLSGENYFFEEVLNSFGQHSEFARLSRIAFGVGKGVELSERVLAGLQLFCQTVDMLSDSLSEDVKDGIMFVAREVKEELTTMRSWNEGYVGDCNI